MLDVIIPCYNEEKVIKKFYDKINTELSNIEHTLIFVDDGSNDKTLQILKNIYENDKKCVRIISFSKNFGKEAAIYNGLKYSKGLYSAIIDADLQQNPKYLTQMYEFLKSNNSYDMITMCQKETKNRFFQKMFYKIINKVSDVHFENGASDFRMFRNNVRKSILNLKEKNRFSKGIFSYVGFNNYYCPYKVEKRLDGNTKWNFKKLFNYGLSGILAFSTKPLRLVTYGGVLTSVIAFIYLIVLFIKTLILGIETPGYASLMCVILFLGGFILLALGIVGEYIAKIYEEVKDRPQYIEKERVGFDEDLL